ncbi:hypothetical protein ACFWBF_14310 [Streptomyces sp. NPDC060028]|uniref:hypothetical protein n=1 Tax=Streptomyces sp. NPDC060028 TaxID=3347041 RepID=UPI0036CDD493
MSTTQPHEPLEPLWTIAANVVQWRRHGEGGQGQRPGTKTFKGGAKVYVCGWSGGQEYCSVAGRTRQSPRFVNAIVPARHLHTFRPRLVRSPALLRTIGFSWIGDEEEAVAGAARLERNARTYRAERWPDRPHPEPCLCHECLSRVP